MAFDIDVFINEFVSQLKNIYGNRLLFTGLQGSYARGEATADSDIDFVVIIKDLTFEDLKDYKKLADISSYREKLCGFIAGDKELRNWSKFDLFQLIFDTKAVCGSLSDIVEKPSSDDVRTFVKINSENLYHGAVHSYLYSRTRHDDLSAFYKNVFYVLQGIYYLKSGKYFPTKQLLAGALENKDREIFEICLNRHDIAGKNTVEVEQLYEELINWSRNNIKIYT